MRNFAPDLGTRTVVTQRPPKVVQEVQNVRTAPPAVSATHQITPEPSWTWRELRDYAMVEIEKRHGPQVRNLAKESGIFKSFMIRWDDQAIRIVKAAFEIYQGEWAGAPISVNRFCKGSDEFFAARILDRLG